MALLCAGVWALGQVFILSEIVFISGKIKTIHPSYRLVKVQQNVHQLSNAYLEPNTGNMDTTETVPAIAAEQMTNFV